MYKYLLSLYIYLRPVLGKPVAKLLTFWYQIKELAPENTMILKPKPCSFLLQRYRCYKNHFCDGDVTLFIIMANIQYFAKNSLRFFMKNS